MVPFLYLNKDEALENLPFGISLDKEETDDSLTVYGLKVLQKTLHSESSYQTFEISSASNESEMGVFALNIPE